MKATALTNALLSFLFIPAFPVHVAAEPPSPPARAAGEPPSPPARAAAEPPSPPARAAGESPVPPRAAAEPPSQPARAADGLEPKTATGHPMQYYLSLPDGWSADRTWPILVVVEAAEKQFRQNAARFVQARGKAPFIVVAPLIVTNGNQGLKNPEIYPYTPETWQRIDQEGGCRFDLEGLARVIQDVQKAWHGEDRFYLTGFEAGAHLVWALTFQHPERPNAAAPVAGNYRGRCMTDSSFSSDPARVRLPIRGFIGAADTAWGPDGRGYAQWEEAKGLAAKHGYTNLSETRVPGKGHVPMPGEVIAWFDALRQSAGSREAR